jgi:hypothetical protein
MVAEERITTEFSGLVGAHGSEGEATFLATQQVDEARHMQFYARFQDEVIATPELISAHVDRARERVSDSFRPIFDVALVDAHQQLLAAPGDLATKVRFVTLYHLVLESTLGLTTFKFITDYLAANALLPGFVDGYSKIHHDETRHIGYGVWYLHETVREHPDTANVVRQTLRDLLPSVTESLKPPGNGAAEAVLRIRRAHPPPRDHRRTNHHSLSSGRHRTSDSSPLLERSGRQQADDRNRRPAVASAGALRDQRKCSDTYAVGLDGDDTAGHEGLDELRQVGFQERGLIGRSVLAAVSEQDHRRRCLLAEREERSEIGVGRDHDAIILCGVVEDLLV